MWKPEAFEPTGTHRFSVAFARPRECSPEAHIDTFMFWRSSSFSSKRTLAVALVDFVGFFFQTPSVSRVEDEMGASSRVCFVSFLSGSVKTTRLRLHSYCFISVSWGTLKSKVEPNPQVSPYLLD